MLCVYACVVQSVCGYFSVTAYCSKESKINQTHSFICVMDPTALAVVSCPTAFRDSVKELMMTEDSSTIGNLQYAKNNI